MLLYNLATRNFLWQLDRDEPRALTRSIHALVLCANSNLGNERPVSCRHTDSLVYVCCLLGAARNESNNLSFRFHYGAPNMSTASPFVLPDEADAITHTHDVTSRRMEKRSLFARRVRIGSRKVAYRRNEFEQWCADPEGWRQRHAVDGGAQ